MNDGYGYGPREATSADAAAAAIAAEAIPEADPRERLAWDEMFATIATTTAASSANAKAASGDRGRGTAGRTVE